MTPTRNENLIEGTALKSPQDGWIAFEETDVNIEYVGNFTSLGSNNYHGGTSKNSTNLNDSVKFNFTGERIRFISARHSNQSNDISFFIDSQEYKINNSGSLLASIVSLEVTNLHGGEHFVRIVNNQGEKQFTIDSIHIDSGGVLKPYKEIVNKSLILHDGEYKKWNEEIGGIDLIPTMTSNNTPNGIVSASGFRTGNEPYYAFDKTTNSIWVVEKTGDVWIQYEFPNSVIVTKYGLVVHTSYNQAPKDFTLKGSNDGVNFVDLDEQIGFTPTTQEEFVFLIKKDKINSYKFYRLYVSQNNENTGLTSLSSLNMYGYIDINDLIDTYIWSEVSSTLPTQEQFLLDGMDSLSPLLDRRVETLEPIKMSSKSEILSGGEGKMFSKTIDLKKYLDIRSIKVEVK